MVSGSILSEFWGNWRSLGHVLSDFDHENDHFQSIWRVKRMPKVVVEHGLGEPVPLFGVKTPKVQKSPKIASDRSLLTPNDVKSHSGWVSR